MHPVIVGSWIISAAFSVTLMYNIFLIRSIISGRLKKHEKMLPPTDKVKRKKKIPWS